MNLDTLARQLRETQDDERRDLALELLARSRRREHVDAALRALEGSDPGDEARPLLRERALYYFDETQRDNGALIREQLLRLLLQIGHPDERDLWLRALHCYEIEPMMGEVTQNLRAIGLVGLAEHAPELAQLHATRLLHELESASRFNSEPALTALNLLAQQKQPLVIYGWLLASAAEALELALDELVGRALEVAGRGLSARALSTAAGAVRSTRPGAGEHGPGDAHRREPRAVALRWSRDNSDAHAPRRAAQLHRGAAGRFA